MVFYKFGTIVLNAPGTLKGRFDRCAGKKGDFPINRRKPPQNGWQAEASALVSHNFILQKNEIGDPFRGSLSHLS